MASDFERKKTKVLSASIALLVISCISMPKAVFLDRPFLTTCFDRSIWHWKSRYCIWSGTFGQIWKSQMGSDYSRLELCWPIYWWWYMGMWFGSHWSNPWNICWLHGRLQNIQKSLYRTISFRKFQKIIWHMPIK